MPDLAEWRARAAAFEADIARAVIGQSRVIHLLTVALLARGHALLEGDVGVGKTTLLRCVARGLGGPYERVEGTIDLMPTDLIYHASIGQDGRPRLEGGPVLRHGSDLSVFFFNEINRARPQVHALLLRLMAERSVTAFNRETALPYLTVFADRNQLEREETFELPAAARDRFMMEIAVRTPDDADMRRDLLFDTRFHDADALVGSVTPGLLDYRALAGVAAAVQDAVSASAHLQRYVLAIWRALCDPAGAGLRMEGVDMQRLVQGGASPRGMGALVRAARVHAWLDGRDAVLPDDVRAVFHEVMGHRVFLASRYEGRAGELCRRVFETVPVP